MLVMKKLSNLISGHLCYFMCTIIFFMKKSKTFSILNVCSQNYFFISSDQILRHYSDSRKYGLGSLRKTPTEGTSPIGPGPTSGQLAIKPTITTTT